MIFVPKLVEFVAFDLKTRQINVHQKWQVILTFIMPTKLKSNILAQVLGLIGLITFAFREMLRMVVWGQGFEFLYEKPLDDFFSALPSSLANFQISSILLGVLGYKLFGVNFQYYYFTWLLIIVAVATLLFFLVYKITGSKLVAFSAALANAVSYVGQMGLIGWIDTSFTGRVPNLLLLVPSFTFLHVYLEKIKPKYLVASGLFYFLGLGVGQFGLLLGSWFICYPVLWSIFPNGKKVVAKSFAASLVFVLISAFFVKVHSAHINPQGPTYSFTHFLLNPRQFGYLSKIPIQLANWSSYPNLIHGVVLSKTSHGLPKVGYSGTLRQYFLDIHANAKATTVVALFYLFALLVIYRRLPKYRAFSLSLVFATLAMFVQNIYIDHYKPEVQAGASRYLLYPTLLLSVFWALFLGATFWNTKNKFFRSIGILILGLYFWVNVMLIHETLDQLMNSPTSDYRGAVALYSYILQDRDSLDANTLVLTPWAKLGCYEGVFLTEQLGKGGVAYWPENAKTNCGEFISDFESLETKSKHVVLLDYDSSCNCVTKRKVK